MRFRLTFATRIGLIVVASVTTVWLGAIALYFVSLSKSPDDARPLAAQVVAIVALLEQTPRDRRQAVLDAVASNVLHVRVEDGEQAGASSQRPLLVLEQATLQHHLDQIGGRASSVTLPHDPQRARWLSRLAPAALEIRVVLRDDQTLVLDTRPTQLVTLFGLPVGFGAGLFGTVIALLALYVMHRETRPLTRLAVAVDRIDPASVGEPLAMHDDLARSAPEIRALLTAFDRLQTRLAHLLKARMAMMAGISHDVRTFATRLRLRVDRIPEDEQRQRAVRDIDDMIRLLDDALLASRAAVGELTDELVDVAEVIRQEVADRQANGDAIALQVDTASDVCVLGDRLALRRVVANLIDNGLKYGKSVTVCVARLGESVVLTVDDEGPGMPSDQRELVLEPFVRLESSRHRGTGGAGLGLAIVRNLVEGQGGSVAVADGPRGGARLIVRMSAFQA